MKGRRRAESLRRKGRRTGHWPSLEGSGGIEKVERVAKRRDPVMGRMVRMAGRVGSERVIGVRGEKTLRRYN